MSGTQEFIDFLFEIGTDQRGPLLPPEELPPSEDPDELGSDESGKKVMLFARNFTNTPGIITAVKVNPPELKEYLDVTGLVPVGGPPVRLEARQGQGCTTSLPVLLHNPWNPPANLHGELEVWVRYDAQHPHDEVRHFRAQITLRPFPSYDGIFALDYGNTNSTCVVLPWGENIKNYARFRALNFDTPNGEERSHASALLLRNIRSKDARRWRVEVGDNVLEQFRDYLRKEDERLQIQTRAVMPSGVKRLIGQDSPENVSSLEQPQAKACGNDLNGALIRALVRRSEVHEPPDTNRPCGRFGQEGGRVVATRPVNFTPNQIQALQKILGDFLGIESKYISTRYDEATAAAIFFLAEQFHGRIHEFWARIDRPDKEPEIAEDGSETRRFNMLVFDCGGGTTDVALLKIDVIRRQRRNAQGTVWTSNSFEIWPTVAGLTGLSDFAGDHMTLEAFRLLRFKLAVRLAHSKHQIDPVSWESGDRDYFQSMRTKLRSIVGSVDQVSTNPEFLSENEACCRHLVPTDFKRDNQGTDARSWRQRSYFYQLWNLAEQVKIELSRNPSCEVNLSPLALLADYQTQAAEGDAPAKTLAEDPDFQTLTLRREELDGRLRKRLESAWEYARDLCLDGETGDVLHSIDQIVLAGNASRYPLVEEMLSQVLAAKKGLFTYQKHKVLPAGPQAKLAVAKGAAIAARYEEVEVNDLDWPDQEQVLFRINPRPVMPYTIYQNAGGEEKVAFRRGEQFPKESGTGEPATLDPVVLVPPRGVVTLTQGLHDSPPRRTRKYADIECKVDWPANVPAEAEVKLVLEIDREYMLRARLEWRDAQGQVLHKLDRPLLEPPPDVNVQKQNPHSGLH